MVVSARAKWKRGAPSLNRWSAAGFCDADISYRTMTCTSPWFGKFTNLVLKMGCLCTTCIQASERWSSWTFLLRILVSISMLSPSPLADSAIKPSWRGVQGSISSMSTGLTPQSWAAYDLLSFREGWSIRLNGCTSKSVGSCNTSWCCTTSASELNRGFLKTSATLNTSPGAQHSRVASRQESHRQCGRSSNLLISIRHPC
jgi:hypothetical protein